MRSSHMLAIAAAVAASRGGPRVAVLDGLRERPLPPINLADLGRPASASFGGDGRGMSLGQLDAWSRKRRRARQGKPGKRGRR